MVQNWVVRSASEVEQNIVSVERILHQTEVEHEAPYEIPETKPIDMWPSKGEIEFRYLYLIVAYGIQLIACPKGIFHPIPA